MTVPHVFPCSLRVPLLLLPNDSRPLCRWASLVFFFVAAACFQSLSVSLPFWGSVEFPPGRVIGSFLSLPKPAFSSLCLGSRRFVLAMMDHAMSRSLFTVFQRPSGYRTDQKNLFVFSEMAFPAVRCNGAATVLFLALWAAIGSHGVPSRTFSTPCACQSQMCVCVDSCWLCESDSEGAVRSSGDSI